MRSVGPPHPDTIGLTAMGSLCIFFRKYSCCVLALSFSVNSRARARARARAGSRALAWALASAAASSCTRRLFSVTLLLGSTPECDIDIKFLSYNSQKNHKKQKRRRFDRTSLSLSSQVSIWHIMSGLCSEIVLNTVLAL